MRTFNTIIVGGGVIGLTIARELNKRGLRDIAVLDKGRIGREASWAAAGILAPQVEADRDDEFFRLCYDSNRMYPRLEQELLQETGIDVEFERGVLYAGFDERESMAFDDRFAWQTRVGLAIERLSSEQIRDLEPDISGDVRCGLLFPEDGQVENRKLVAALARYAELNSIHVIEGINVDRIVTDHDRANGVEAGGECFMAERVVLATGAWTSLIKLGESTVPIDVRPMRGQMVCYKDPDIHIKHVIYSRSGYLVPRSDARLLAGATVEDVGFERATTDEARSVLEKMAIEIAPALAHETIAEHWAGFRPYTNDGRPIIGSVPNVDNLFMATGHFRNGILLAPITGKLIADAVMGANDSRSIGISPA